MQKHLLSLFIIVGMLFSCSEDKQHLENLSNANQISSTYVFAYKSDADPVSSTRGVTLKSKLWANGSTIRIKFLNGNTIVQNKVQEVAKEWTKYANLKFDFVSSDKEADVRIAFQWNGDRVTWSYIGTDNKTVAQNAPSMNLTLFNVTDMQEINSDDFKASILRNFGHVLGLVFENQSPKAEFKWDAARVRNYFLAQGWNKADIEKLMSVYSTNQTNYTQFDENSIMLLFFPHFLTKNGVETKYNTDLSATDKNFIRSIYPGKAIEHPKRIKLEYKQLGDNKAYEYNAVLIGEYYWIDNNFYHKAPRLGGTFNSGGEPEITTEMIDTYMRAIHMDLNHKDRANFPKQVYNIENFNKYYGRYYNRESINYMSQNGKMYIDGEMSTNWELPSYHDYRQLFAMCPIKHGRLTHDDIQVMLAAKHGDNPATSPYYIETHDHLIKGELPQLAGKCYNGSEPAYHAVYWNTDGLTSHRPIENIYGFNLMASGTRGNNTHAWFNGLYEIDRVNNDGSAIYAHDGQNQYIYQLFYAVSLYTKESNIIIHDWIETARPYSYHWFPARWCKRLTDEELGYKLYINSAQTDIKKLSLTDPAPAGYKELPNGYLRGFYVQYILNNPNPKHTIADIVKLSKTVWDTTL